MIDSNSQFFATLTAVGEAKQANATALGIPWTFKEMAVGDANGSDPVPNKTQTKLINEWRRAPVNQVRTDPANPNVIITEQVIPPDIGGHWIREIGLFDADGDLVAVANCAPTFKPLLAQGTGKTQIIRMNFIVSNTAQIVLKIDPAVVLATRQYVDDSLATALPANKAAGTYRQVTIDKRGVVLSGTNPTTVAGYGITDAFTKPETTAAIQEAVAKLVASSPAALDTLKELADALGNDPNFSTTMTNALAGKAAKATTLAGYGITDAMKKFAGGIETQAVPSSNNLDSIGSSGLNSFHASTANRPSGSTYGTVLHISYDQPTGSWTQFAVAAGDSRAWFRGCVNGSLQAWQELWNSGNLNPGNLQQKLGFTPVQQGTGHGQGSNTVKIGWSNDQNSKLRLTVDNSDIGYFLTSADLKPADYIKKGQALAPGESPACISFASGSITGVSGSSGGIEVRGSGGAAIFSFHRPGSFGVNFGLDTDNQLKVGGWSMGGVAHTIWHSGNFDPNTSQGRVGIQGAFSGLSGAANGTSPTATYTAEELVVGSPSFRYQTIRSVNVSPSLSGAGANGLDVGVSAPNTWYSAWIIWNGAAAAGLFSLSTTAPAMPAGYTHKARIGWVRSDANKNLVSFTQAGKSWRYKTFGNKDNAVAPTLAAGAAGDPYGPSLVAVSVSHAVPPTASQIFVIANSLTTGAYLIAHPNSYSGGYDHRTNPPQIAQSVSVSGGAYATSAMMALESSNIYWAANTARAFLICLGFEDNF
ncbi:phage tail-collar fiber domain-containing protein [Pseudomonas piscis]